MPLLHPPGFKTNFTTSSCWKTKETLSEQTGSQTHLTGICKASVKPPSHCFNTLLGFPWPNWVWLYLWWQSWCYYLITCWTGFCCYFPHPRDTVLHPDQTIVYTLTPKDAALGAISVLGCHDPSCSLYNMSITSPTFHSQLPILVSVNISPTSWRHRFITFIKHLIYFKCLFILILIIITDY